MLVLWLCETYLSESVVSYLCFLLVCSLSCCVLVFIEAASSMTHPWPRQGSLGSLAAGFERQKQTNRFITSDREREKHNPDPSQYFNINPCCQWVYSVYYIYCCVCKIRSSILFTQSIFHNICDRPFLSSLINQTSGFKQEFQVGTCKHLTTKYIHTVHCASIFTYLCSSYEGSGQICVRSFMDVWNGHVPPGTLRGK